MKGYAVPPEHYGTLINDTKTLTNKKLSEVAMQQVFGSSSCKFGQPSTILLVSSAWSEYKKTSN